jgi:hypothetical protein
MLFNLSAQTYFKHQEEEEGAIGCYSDYGPVFRGDGIEWELGINEPFNETFKWPYPILEQRSTKIKEVTPKPRRPRKTPYRTQMFSNSPIPRYKDE